MRIPEPPGLLEHPFVPEVMREITRHRPDLVPFILAALRAPLRTQLVADYAALTGESREAVTTAWDAQVAILRLPAMEQLPDDDQFLHRTVYEPHVLYTMWNTDPELGTFLIQVLTEDQRVAAANAVATWATIVGVRLTWVEVMTMWLLIPARDEPPPRRRRRARKAGQTPIS